MGHALEQMFQNTISEQKQKENLAFNIDLHFRDFPFIATDPLRMVGRPWVLPAYSRGAVESCKRFLF